MSRNRIRVFPIWFMLSAIWMIVAVAGHVPREIWLLPPLLFGGGLSLLRWITDRRAALSARDLNTAAGDATPYDRRTEELAIKYKRRSSSKSP